MPTVLILAPCFLPGYKGGGPVKSIFSIVSTLSNEFNFKILSFNFDLDGKIYNNVPENKWVDFSENVQVFYSSKSMYFKNLRAILNSNIFEICYLNSFFSLYFTIIPLILLNPQKKIILAPRGEFSSGALSLKNTKKSIFFNLVKFIPLYRKVSRWHATSVLEYNDIKHMLHYYNFSSSDEIHIAENLSLSLQDNFAKLPLVLKEYLGILSKEKALKICFLSRISPKKNLHFIADILHKCKEKIIFDIYGPLEDLVYYQFCLNEFKKVGSNVIIQYQGEVEPFFVSKVIGSYDLFLFPTLGENFGHVIAESFSVGTPVLISDQTPWRNLSLKDIGWDIPLTEVSKFSSIIDDYACLDSNEKAKKRSKCLDYYEENFNNPSVVLKTIDLFNF